LRGNKNDKLHTLMSAVEGYAKKGCHVKVHWIDYSRAKRNSHYTGGKKKSISKMVASINRSATSQSGALDKGVGCAVREMLRYLVLRGGVTDKLGGGYLRGGMESPPRYHHGGGLGGGGYSGCYRGGGGGGLQH